jgi:predicted transposase/invertase (TIGR01784 family)
MSTKEETKKGGVTMRGKYLNPKADLIFKLVFGEHPDLVMSLLNALLPLPEDGLIESVEYLTPEMVPENPAKKDSIVDVRCKDQQGRQFIVEMQLYWNEEFKRRVLLNASKAIVRQLDKGEDYSLIQPVYCLSLVNDKAFDYETDEFYHDYAIVDVEHTDRHIEGLRLVFVELPKFKPQSIAEKKMAVLWLRFLTEIAEDTIEAPAELLENEQTRKALGLVEKSAMTEGQLYAYEKFWLAVVDERILREAATKKGYNEGMQKGIEEGMQKGIEEGMQKGMQKGIEEGMQKGIYTVARNMKQMGLPIADIAKATGLSKEEIRIL